MTSIQQDKQNEKATHTILQTQEHVANNNIYLNWHHFALIEYYE